MTIPHGTHSGYSYHKCKCDECVAGKKARDRAYYLANAEKVKARQRAKYVPNPITLLTDEEKKHRKAESVRRYKDQNREEIRAKGRERYRKLMATDPESVRKQRREYAKTPYGRAMYYSFQNRRRRGVPYTKESLDWIASIDWSNTFCTYCEDALATEIDHILPITKGGTGERDNLTPVCRSCNARKGNLYLAEFLGFVDPERMQYA